MCAHSDPQVVSNVEDHCQEVFENYANFYVYFKEDVCVKVQECKEKAQAFL